MVDIVAGSPDPVRHHALEFGVGFSMGDSIVCRNQRARTAIRVVEEVLQVPDTPCPRSGEIDLVKINLLRVNILQVNAYIESLTLELARQKRAVQDKREELVAAKQSEETLEILKRKRHEVYLAEQLQIESRAQDDIYIAQAFRNQQQGA